LDTKIYLPLLANTYQDKQMLFFAYLVEYKKPYIVQKTQMIVHLGYTRRPSYSMVKADWLSGWFHVFVGTARSLKSGASSDRQAQCMRLV
jgi:hypothetical protein